MIDAQALHAAHGTQDSASSSLAGKTVLVTGASSGIGQGIAIELARLGADVAVNYVRNAAGAQETVGAVRALGVRAEAFRCDVSSRADLFGMIESIDAVLGGPDIVVSNSVEVLTKPLMDVTEAEWQRAMEITCSAFLYLAQASAPIMRRRGAGWLIGITSLGAHRVLDDYALLGVPKAALEHLMRYLAAELRPQGIRVNAVSPGAVKTAAMRAVRGDELAEERMAMFRATAPARQTAMPADIGRLVAFLCSPQADLVVGQTLVIDGGMSLY
ncbi:SDR family oxidoreductase [Variovorax sp. PBL-E5]|uniref:SDR family oxidoreductase n=1 Tax=Variovorax sp. PBL-E5 TaxID=434014 RepID=UPI001317A601|nr:SDR family oxidoreductase [Variovorax sp. PBL-E5]VTU45268.1 Enoyl-[acyl-carrier-protein] reductase [NADPH] FabL [Variovorax sp. PBL-E5]